MADSSFDIVSKIDRQEVDNALGQTAREIATRFDFKGTGATIEWQGDEAIEISASADDRASAVLDVFKDQAGQARRASRSSTPPSRASPASVSKIRIALKEGISSEDAKKISKLIRDEGPKGVKAQIQGDELRISSKKRDDLQAVQALVKRAGLRLRGAVHQLPLSRVGASSGAELAPTRGGLRGQLGSELAGGGGRHRDRGRAGRRA